MGQEKTGIFNQVEHVLLVGVAGGVHHYGNASRHVRPGDVVVSMTPAGNGPMYLHCSTVQHKKDEDRFIYQTRAFTCRNKILQNVALNIDSIVRSEWTKSRPWEIYMDLGLQRLSDQETNFHRPPVDKDLRRVRQADGSIVVFEHPAALCKEEIRVNTPAVRLGAIGSGKLVSRIQEVRRDFATRADICAYDLDFEAVLESLEGNRNESFLVIRGICDYADGAQKEWQPYAALAAAAYMKALVMAL